MREEFYLLDLWSIPIILIGLYFYFKNVELWKEEDASTGIGLMFVGIFNLCIGFGGLMVIGFCFLLWVILCEIGLNYGWWTL